MSDTKTGKQISEYDQILAGIVDLGKIMAEYRKSMIDNGIPEKLADEMTKLASTMFWENTLSKGMK